MGYGPSLLLLLAMMTVLLLLLPLLTFKGRLFHTFKITPTGQLYWNVQKKVRDFGMNV